MTEDITRRTALGAAWSIPVIALAVAAPAAAASDTPPVCEKKTWVSTVGEHDVAKITVVTGESVVVEFVKPYPNATALNINGQIIWKSNDGASAGDVYYAPLDDICDPTFIQVDGNNTHYYGGGVFR